MRLKCVREMYVAALWQKPTEKADEKEEQDEEDKKTIAHIADKPKHTMRNNDEEFVPLPPGATILRTILLRCYIA